MKHRLFPSRLSLTVVTAILALGFVHLASAQTSRGTVAGTVMDRSGGVIPGATVKLTNMSTGVARSTLTNDAGIYRFDAVDLGVYDLKITMPGFNDFLRRGLSIEANRTATIDVRLEVGNSNTLVEVSAAAADLLVKDAPLRGGNFQSHELSHLPLAALNPISLARTLPGVSQASGSRTWGFASETIGFSVNGQRPRANNFLLDGTDNNDNYAGTVNAQSFNMADAIQELSVQTGHFGVEFGRTGGGVFNVITKAGTNAYHGTALWQYRSQRFNSVSNTDKLNGAPQSVFSQNIYGFTLGGPLRQNKTFFFGAFQQDTGRSTRNYKFAMPTAETVTRLRSLFPSNPRLDLYLNAVGDLRGMANPFPLALGVDPVTGVDRGAATFGTAPVGLPSTNEGPQGLLRLDHNLSEAHRLSLRYLYESRTALPLDIPTVEAFAFPGYVPDRNMRNQNFLFTDNYTAGPTWTNEFRVSYGRLGDNYGISPRSVPSAQTMPRIFVANVATPYLPSWLPRFSYSNNWLFQETQTKVVGRHTFRYGVEFLRQLAKERAQFAFDERGSIIYQNSTGYSAFANFLDDFSGPSGQITRNFGSPIYYPKRFRQSYFFQDAWKMGPSLTLTLGLRYENFGQPANGAFKYPAFAGFDPGQFLIPNKVHNDNKDLGPSFGLAWSPSYKSGLLGRLLGDGKTVWRGGYQISYDTLYNMILDPIAADTPNSIKTVITAPNIGRGTPNWLAQLPNVSHAARPLDDQTGVLDKNIRNPYTERWSFGVQRELPSQILLDLSYIGSESHRLFTNEDRNVQQLNGVRMYPNLGIRRLIGSSGNAAYHAFQGRVDRRFAQGFSVTGSYTWSRSIDSTSELVSSINSNVYTSLPVNQGGLKIDRGISDYDRKHRLTIAYVWDLPGPKNGLWKQVLDGWSITGITAFQSGAPFTVRNGFDRNNDGIVNNDRPDIGNPRAPVNTRAVPAPGCSTGYRNPDTGACVNSTDVHFIAVERGLPGSATVGRNTLCAGWVNNWDMSLFKTFFVKEAVKLEFRWEAFNIFNHPQFVTPPPLDVLRTPPPAPGQPSRFLNRDYTDSGIRTMRVQFKFLF